MLATEKRSSLFAKALNVGAIKFYGIDHCFDVWTGGSKVMAPKMLNQQSCHQFQDKDAFTRAF
jgi:hypothetical protein